MWDLIVSVPAYLFTLFYFIDVCIAPGQEETTFGDKCFDGSRKVITLITDCMFQKIALPSDFMHFS